jgi:hypothetical protein
MSKILLILKIKISLASLDGGQLIENLPSVFSGQNKNINKISLEWLAQWLKISLRAISS